MITPNGLNHKISLPAHPIGYALAPRDREAAFYLDLERKALKTLLLIALAFALAAVV